jgi:predicted secreted protein
MSSNAKTALGAKLYMGPDGGTLIEIAELLTLTLPTMTRETIDVTTLSSSGAKEFIAGGVYDTGEVSGSVHYIAGSAGDDAMIAALTDGVVRGFKAVVKSAGDTEDMMFSGYLTSYGIDEFAVDGKQSASFTAKVTGAITQAAS